MKRKLLLNTFLFSLLLECLAVILFFVMPKQYISPALLFLVPLFLATSLLANLFLIASNPDKPYKFIRSFMLSTFLKFMFYIVVLVAYVMLFRSDAVNFIISFFILFVLYLIFDVVFLLNNKTENNNPVK